MQREEAVRRAVELVDLTSLNDDDTPERIAALCEQAKAAGVAAVSINAPFVRQAKRAGVRVATVVNFPDGTKEHRFVRAETHPSRDDAAQFSVSKGKQIIDQRGDGIFGAP